MKIIVTVTAGNLIAVNSANGKLLWKFDYEEQTLNIPVTDTTQTLPYTVMVVSFAAKWLSTGRCKTEVKPERRKPTVVWKNTDLTPHMGGMVLL